VATIETNEESLRSSVARLRGSAEFPDEAIDYAQRVTRAAMSRPGSGQWTPMRVEAYLTAVVRRRVLRRHPATPAAARVVADSVVADLLAHGRTGKDAYDELRRGWRSAVPEALLEEYRQALCA